MTVHVKDVTHLIPLSEIVRRAAKAANATVSLHIATVAVEDPVKSESWTVTASGGTEIDAKKRLRHVLQQQIQDHQNQIDALERALQHVQLALEEDKE
jgi:hypothetical protein